MKSLEYLNKDGNANENALFILANIYYDRQNLPWNELFDMAAYLYQCSLGRFGPKGTRELSGALLKLFYEIKEKAEEAPSHFYTEDMNPISLGKMDGRGHLTQYNEIAELSYKMQSQIKDKRPINDFIMELGKELSIQLHDYVEDGKIDNSLQEDIQEHLFNLGECMNTTELWGPEDVFREWKILKRLEDKNKMIINEKVNATLERLNALYNMTLDENRKKYLEKCILDLNHALIGGLINEEILDKENIFRESVRR